ncbi:MAG TPA: pitrilysin family protein [Patescibacteria group bacterium]|nr:pitrilysin family protein [Patescibacteria group bacterium]
MQQLFGMFLAFFLLAASPAEAKTFNAETFTLENGLQVVVIENHRAPVVTHMVWYKFGAADEKPGESGVAHFLEHLMFKGTPKVPDGEFSLAVKKMGGADNAFTSHDYTAYYQNVPRASLAKVMEMEADRMGNLVLKEDQIASEREVIVEERRQRIDNQPQDKFQEQLMSALFVNHPYATPIIGWLHEMKELTRDEVLSYYNTWYAPNNAIVIVSGDVTAAELKPLVEKYYAPLAIKEVPRRYRPRPAPIVAEHQIIMQDPRIGQPVAMKNYRVPHGSDTMEVLAQILGGTSTARLYKSLVVDQKIAVNAGADYDAIAMDDTTFSVFASPAPGSSIQQVQAAIDKEIRLLIDKGVTLEELNAAKNRLEASFTYYRDSLQGPATLFGRVLSSGMDMDYVENRIDRIEKLSIDDINDAIDAVFQSNDLPVTGVMLPQISPPPRGGKGVKK